tara:strand:+ start:15403 stop:16806 length:1404 start_codon:yes stop_codon:yes gene_type:complete
MVMLVVYERKGVTMTVYYSDPLGVDCRMTADLETRTFDHLMTSQFSGKGGKLEDGDVTSDIARYAVAWLRMNYGKKINKFAANMATRVNDGGNLTRAQIRGVVNVIRNTDKSKVGFYVPITQAFAPTTPSIMKQQQQAPQEQAEDMAQAFIDGHQEEPEPEPTPNVVRYEKEGAERSVRKGLPKALRNLIPSIEEAQNYIRRVDDGVEDVERLRIAYRLGHNSMITGHTGTGKTACVRSYCAQYNLPYHRVVCDGSVEPASFLGRWVPTAKDTFKWQDGPATMIVRHGGTLYLDEVNFMPPRIGSIFHPLLDDDRTLTIMEKDSEDGGAGSEVIHAHEDCQVIVSYNPEYKGTRPLNEAFKNRFATKIHFEYSTDVEKELLWSDTVQELVQKLRTSYDLGDISTPPSTNMMMEFEELAFQVNVGYAMTNLINAFEPGEKAAVRNNLLLFEDAIAADVATWTDEEGGK